MTRYFADMPTDADYLQNIAASVQKEAIVMNIDFGLLTNALQAFGLEDLYSLVSADAIQGDKVQAILDQWFAKLTAGPITDDQRQKLVAMWLYLAADDSESIKPADVIFVFGGPELVKAQKAVELYQAGMAPQIIFTGDTQRALQATPHQSESVRDAEFAIAAGVPTDAILIENTSVNTPENVQNALKILTAKEPFPTRFILVNLPWYLCRATNTFVTYWRNAPVPATSIKRVNAGSGQFTAENYFESRRGLEYVVFEYLKIKQARDMKHM